MPAPSPSPPTTKDEKEVVTKDTEPATTKRRGSKKKEASVERSKTPAVDSKSDDKPLADFVTSKDDGVKKSNLPTIKPKEYVVVSMPTVASSETVSEAKTISTTTGTKNATPQVFHVSGAPLGCLNTTVNNLPSGSTVVAATVSAPTTFLAPQTSGRIISTVATLSVPVVTVATMVAPVATITPPVISESFKWDIKSASKDKRMASKADKLDKGKQKSMANRPIVPAPAAKMLNLNAAVNVTQSTLSPVSTYGMYPYYVQPPHLIPVVSPASHSPHSREQSVERDNNDANTSTSGVKIKKEPPDSLREFSSKSGGTASSSEPSAGDGKSASGRADEPQQQLTPTKHQQQQLMVQQEMFLQQQQILQQQLLAAGIPPQAHYQYLAQYQYYLANDPQYRMRYEQVMEEHQQALREREMSQQKDGGAGVGGGAGVWGGKVAPIEDVKTESRSVCSDDGRKTSSDKTPTSQSSSLERSRTERSMQEEMRESHQIMRENIELKSQMEAAVGGSTSRLSKTMDPYDPAQLVKKQQEDLQRFYMFQRQQILEHKKVQDSSKQSPRPDGAGSSAPRNVPELQPIDDNKPKASASATLGSIGHEQSPRASPKLRREEARSDKSSPDPMKRQDRQKSGTPLAGKSVSRADTPKSSRTPPTMQSPASQQSAAAAFPVFAAANPYHYASFDVGHPMYRGPPIMGYNPAGYIHPSQMRYHVSPMEAEKDKAAVMMAGAKSLDPAYFSPAGQHKIHELKEQAKPPTASTGEKSSSTTDRSTGSPFKKRRESSSPPAQRHPHTHDHTHVAYPLYADPYLLTGQPNMPFGPKT